MQHLLSRRRPGNHVSLLAAVVVATMPFSVSSGPALAEHLVALGQERAQVSDRTATKPLSISKEPAPIRKSQHKLIKKSPTVSVQPNQVVTPPTNSSTPKTAVALNAAPATQVPSKDATVLNSTASSTVAPAKSSITTTTPATSLSVAGALSSPTSSTASGSSPVSAIAVPGSSNGGGNSNNGRGMKKLSSAMPELTQLLAPTTATVSASAPLTPVIARNPASIAFSAIQNGAAPSSQTVTVSNSGSGTLNWTATSSVPWLTVNGGAAASGVNSGSFAVGANISGLSIGNYTGNVVLAAAGATNAPQSIAVTLSVTAAPTPTIGLSATAFSFTAVQGGGNPSSQTLNISNTGASTLNWTVAENASWLTPSVAGGTGSGSVALNVNTTGMAAGTYTTPLTIAATGATNTPQTVMVTLTLTAPLVPTIGLAPTSLNFSTTQGGSNPSVQTVNITNSGTGTLSWNATSTASWLAVTPASGTGPGAFSATANVTGLSAGTYTASITVIGTGATNSPQSIPVSLTVTGAAPTLTVGSSSLSFTGTQGAANPAAQSLSITSNGSWSVTEAVSWLTVSPASGSNNGTLSVAVDTTTAVVGTNTGTLTVTGGGLTRTVTVTFTLAAAPTTLSVTPSSLTFTATQGAANPAAQTLTVAANTNWSVSENSSWLTVNPLSASNNSTVTVSVNTATAVVGANSATITLTGGGMTRTVNVTLTLNPVSTSSATLTWDPNTDSDLASYRVYQTTTPGVYGTPIATVPAGATTYTRTGLTMGSTYYFRITAVDSTGNESLPSNEVSKSVF